MWKNYLHTIIRGVWKNKVFSAINILGLALGLACSLLMLLYVQHEFSYDQHHDNFDRIYRVTIEGVLAGNEIEANSTPYPMAAVLPNEFPEIETAARFRRFFQDTLVSIQDLQFQEPEVFHTDPQFFDIFSFNFLAGDPETVLDDPNTIVITEAIAAKLFPDSDPMGQQLTFNNDRSYQVVGIVDAMPATSHFHPQIFVSFSSDEQDGSTNWVSNNIVTYFTLTEGSSATELADKLKLLVTKYVAPQISAVIGMSIDEFFANGGRYDYVIQPLADIHLYSNLEGELETNGNANYVYTFLAVALFVLLLACINFMNLSTARSANRAREIGVRKVMGAHQSQLLKQFLLESVLLSFLALAIALPLVAILLPAFNVLTAKEMSIGVLFGLQAFLLLVFFTSIVGLISGSYPAVFLSRFHPQEVLKGKFSGGAKSSWFRGGLVILQFTISITLVASTLIVYEQLNFMQNKSLGFEQDQVLVIKRARALGDQLESFKQVLSNQANVVNVSSSAHVPGESVDQNVYALEGQPLSEASPIWSFTVGYNYVETLGFELLEGREYSEEFGSDEDAYIVNETAARLLGASENPTQYRIVAPGPEGTETGQIIGLVKDFHFQSLHQEIRPVLFRFSDFARYIVVRIGTNDVQATITSIQTQWQTATDGEPFEYSFLDEDFESLHDGDQRLGQLFTGFATFAIFIASLGLYGLASFTTEQRTKEIGIRKTLGAGVTSLVLMMSKEFMVLVVVALMVAVPVTYFSMNQWLQLFSYRIDLPLTAIAVSGGIAMLVAFLTVSIESTRAALTNPVLTLRDE